MSNKSVGSAVLRHSARLCGMQGLGLCTTRCGIGEIIRGCLSVAGIDNTMFLMTGSVAVSVYNNLAGSAGSDSQDGWGSVRRTVKAKSISAVRNCLRFRLTEATGSGVARDKVD